MKFKPQLFPTIFTAIALVTLLVLGTWQMNRLAWKTNIIKEMNERISMPAVDLPENVGNFDDYKYRKVKLRGEFMHDKEVHLFVGPRSERGNAGYDILTPLKREDGTYVLVDRGWVDSDKKSKENRPETITEGVVEIEGMLHKGEVQKRFIPDNDVEKNLWFWIDINAVESYAGINLQNLYVRALKKEDEKVGYPIAGDPVIKFRNDHLQYAITWYGLAVILLVIFYLSQRVKIEEESE